MADADLVVDTVHGKVRGKQRGEVAIWKGIPYAAPPVGDQRFRPPQPVQPWNGERDGTRFGAASAQTRDPRIAMISGVSDKFPTGEDCLTLNVYAPAGAPAGAPPGARTGAKRPVMVWLHGGAFVMGAASTPLYNGAAFAERGVIVVTLNYRLGILGLLYLGDLVGGHEEGNYLLLDQIAALRWVRDNIAAFGGDPAQVTVMGESAGAISIGWLLAMPAARGLFQRAILESGAAPVTPLTREHATGLARHVIDALGVTVDELFRVPVDRLIAVQEDMSRVHGIGAFAPYIDGVTVPNNPAEIIREGSAANIAILGGSNRDEWTLFDVFFGEATVDAFKGPLRDRLGAELDRLVETYRNARPGASDKRAWVDLVGEVVFRIPMIRLAEAQASHGVPVYMYRFDWESPAFDGKLGATHALELAFVWNRLDLPTAPILLGPDLAAVQPLATAMHDTWVAFITSGDPNGAGLPAWPRYDLDRRQTLLIDRESRVVDDPVSSTRQAWQAALALAAE
jgi:para-nitrobenzyl esterase